MIGEDIIMKITYMCKCEPNDLEKKMIEKVLKNHGDLLLNQEDGKRLILPHDSGAIFLNKNENIIEVIDFVFTNSIITIK